MRWNQRSCQVLTSWPTDNDPGFCNAAFAVAAVVAAATLDLLRSKTPTILAIVATPPAAETPIITPVFGTSLHDNWPH